MKPADPDSLRDPRRRAFTRRAAVAAAGRSLAMPLAAAVAATAAGEARAWSALSPAEVRTLVRMCRDIYPHDVLSDDVYEAALAGTDAEAARDMEAASRLAEGLQALDGLSRTLFGTPYALVPRESDRAEVLARIEDSAFFQKLRAGLVTGLYNQPAVWAALGYEGPSAQEGGYLTRGFDDLDWL